jgi:hypothetical protein
MSCSIHFKRYRAIYDIIAENPGITRGKILDASKESKWVKRKIQSQTVSKYLSGLFLDGFICYKKDIKNDGRVNKYFITNKEIPLKPQENYHRSIFRDELIRKDSRNFTPVKGQKNAEKR